MSTQNQEGLAPAAGGIEDDGVRELHPVIMWGKSDEFDLYDFRAKPETDTVEVLEEVDDPKVSSAAGSALAAIYETVKTPSVDSRQSRVQIASVETEVIPTKESEIGSPTSFENEVQKTGKTEPSVEK